MSLAVEAANKYDDIGAPSDPPDVSKLTASQVEAVTAMVSGTWTGVHDASETTQTATLVPGESLSLTLPVYPAYYRVDTDMDAYVKNSSASGCYGVQLADDTDCYSTTPGSLAAQTGLDFAAASFTMETWVELIGATPNGARVLGFGSAGGPQLDVYFSNAASGNVRLGTSLVGNAGSTIKADSSATALGDTYPLGHLYHLAVVWIRAAGGATGYVRYFLNGVQVQQATWTEAGTPTDFNLSTSTSGASRLVIGGTVGANAEWDGRIEDLKFYGTALSVSQIQARALAGPVRALGIDAGDAYLQWWVSFQNADSWADPALPECVSGYGNAVFDTKVGAGSVSQRTGGAAASAQDSARVYAFRPQKIYCPNQYLNITGDSASGGRIAVTRVEE